MILANQFVNNNTNRDAIKLVHLGLSANIKNSILNFKASRKINNTDLTKYKLSLDKKINKASVYIYIVGDEQDSGIGMGLSYIF